MFTPLSHHYAVQEKTTVFAYEYLPISCNLYIYLGENPAYATRSDLGRDRTRTQSPPAPGKGLGGVWMTQAAAAVGVAPEPVLV